MTVTAAALRELHRMHRQITDLRGRLERGPRQLRAAQADQEQIEESSGECKEMLTRTRILADDKQLQLREREDRVQDLQAKLNSCGSNREYQVLVERIAADEQANSVLSDEILEALEKIDEQTARLEELVKDRDKRAEDFVNLRARVEKERLNLESELERINRDLAQAEDKLPADFKADYQRIARARGEDTLAQVDGQTCSGCYQVLTTNTINALMLSRPVFCNSCGALLYFAEDRAPDSGL